MNFQPTLHSNDNAKIVRESNGDTGRYIAGKYHYKEQFRVCAASVASFFFYSFALDIRVKCNKPYMTEKVIT